MSQDDMWDEYIPKPKQENTLETFLKKWLPEANPPQRKLLIDHVEGLIKEARIDERDNWQTVADFGDGANAEDVLAELENE